MRRQRLTIADRPRHRIEAVEELPKLTRNVVAVALRYRLDAPLADPFDVTRKYAEGLQHMLHGKVPDYRKCESQAAVDKDEREYDLRAHAQETGDVDLGEDPADGKAFCA